MYISTFPVIDMSATGKNIKRLRVERCFTVRDLQHYFGFEEPQAIYKWQSGKSLPSVDNLFALSHLLDVPMEQILIPVRTELYMNHEQHAEPCCSCYFLTGYSGYGKSRVQLRPFFSIALLSLEYSSYWLSV